MTLASQRVTQGPAFNTAYKKPATCLYNVMLVPPEALSSEYCLISFNISTLMVEELSRIVSPSGPMIGTLSEPSSVVPPATGSSSSFSRMEQGAPGLQNGLWVFQSCKRQRCSCCGYEKMINNLRFVLKLAENGQAVISKKICIRKYTRTTPERSC